MSTAFPTDESPFSVIYEDNHLIAVNKCNGVLVQGDETGDPPLSAFVKQYIIQKYNKPGDAYLGVIHRIDRPVSGIVLMAKTSKALNRMSQKFRRKTIWKYYYVIVRGIPKEPEDTLDHWLRKLPNKNIVKAHQEEVADSKFCRLSYKLVAQIDQQTALLKVCPKTGRSHQIRVQLAAIGSIIVGDVKYGFPEEEADGNVYLHAYTLSFIHPVQKRPMRLSADPPDLPLWNQVRDYMNDEEI